MECNGQNVLSVWTIFCTPPPKNLPNNPKNQNFDKMKKMPGIIIVYIIVNIIVYHKWQSYDVWFLRNGAWQTNFFVILDHFLPFYPANNPKNWNLKKWKKSLEIYYFTHTYHKWKSWCMVPEKWSTTDRIFCHFGQFFSLLTP